MKPIIIEMKNLSESTEIYEKKPNPAIVWFVYILLGITVISVLWMALTKIDIVTEATGIIGYTDDVIEVRCDRDARIVKCNVENGQYVTEGTILFELKAVSDDNDSDDDTDNKDTKKEDLVNGQPVIRAKENGYFFSSAYGEVGCIAQAGTGVGLIFAKPEKTFQAEIVVVGNDIGKIREGQEVKLEIDAFPSSEYGIVTGRIRKISTDAQWDQENGMSVFPVWVEFDATALTDKNNAEVSLVSGLSCRAKIVTGREQVLTYVWDSIR